VARSRAQSVVEAAGLIAANDLSKIIIDDSHYGLVSLSNYPPIGKGTCAPDGEPLPVTGINTIVGTVRQNAIVAQELQNAQMSFLVDRDKDALDLSIEQLNATFSECLKNSTGNNSKKEKWLDIQANPITPTEDVETFLRKNLPENVKIESIKLTNGWLEGEGDTTIRVPQPTSLAQISNTTANNGSYRPFVNIPAARRNFNFAGVGAKSSLVSSSAFRAADKKHICSIVRLECVLKLESLGKIKIPFYDEAMNKAYCVATCQPFAMPDSGPKGAMTLRFTGGPVAGLRSWSDFLRDGTFRDNKVTTYDAVGGDYPLDAEARMLQTSPAAVPTTSNQFAEHFYYWLRNGHTKPRIDGIIEMVNAQFQSGPNEIYAYEFANDGAISRRIISKDPFPIGVTAESQYSTIADTNVQGGIAPIVIFRNDVKNLSRENGGKHCGQPLTLPAPGMPSEETRFSAMGAISQSILLPFVPCKSNLPVSGALFNSTIRNFPPLRQLSFRLRSLSLPIQSARNAFNTEVLLSPETLSKKAQTSFWPSAAAKPLASGKMVICTPRPIPVVLAISSLSSILVPSNSTR
jgi:hypothetical protein